MCQCFLLNWLYFSQGICKRDTVTNIKTFFGMARCLRGQRLLLPCLRTGVHQGPQCKRELDPASCTLTSTFMIPHIHTETCFKYIYYYLTNKNILKIQCLRSQNYSIYICKVQKGEGGKRKRTSLESFKSLSKGV